MKRLGRLVYDQRDISAYLAKESLGLESYSRSIQRYLNSLGWVKVRTRFCQMVSHRAQIEKIIFSNLCLITADFKLILFQRDM